MGKICHEELDLLIHNFICKFEKYTKKLLTKQITKREILSWDIKEEDWYVVTKPVLVFCDGFIL